MTDQTKQAILREIARNRFVTPERLEVAVDRLAAPDDADADAALDLERPDRFSTEENP